jgi:hypothetical protein
MRAAHGLLQTAISLHGRAEREIGDLIDAQVEQRFDTLVSELFYCAQTIEVEMVSRRMFDGIGTDGGDA